MCFKVYLKKNWIKLPFFKYTVKALDKMQFFPKYTLKSNI